MQKRTIFVLIPILFLYLFISRAAAQEVPTNPLKPLAEAKQILVVITNDWSDLHGTLYAFNRSGKKWTLAFSNRVVVGSKGMGMGDGLISMHNDSAPVKHEGDLKAPAGIFTIGAAFGYADADSATWIKNPYIKAADTVICVDDVHSAYYNTLLKTDTVKSDWNSFEYMHRKDIYYKWGLFINHNAAKPVPGHGSCIFMHIWGNDHEGTEGCTAMREEDLLTILHWINARSNPLLIQLPKKEYVKLRALYNLPNTAD